jgi:RNA polymerase sigma factor (sigma-70 family)
MSDETSLHIVRAIGGDQDSVGWLIANFRGLVEAQVRLRLRGQGSPQDVEDVAGDVWVVVLQKLSDLVPREGRHAPVLVRFLGSTVLGTCNNFLRKRARCIVNPGTAAADGSRAEPIDELAARSRAVVSRILMRESASVVDACLAQMSDEHRDVLVLRLMEERTNQEIAGLLGVAANTIAVRYRRALDALRARLPPALFGELAGREDQEHGSAD